MRKGSIRYVVILLPLLMLMLASWSAANKKSAGAPPGNTGGANEILGACTQSGCHDDRTLNSGPGFIELKVESGLSNYEPSKRYTVSVKVTQSGSDKFGFQLLALEDAGNTNIGDISLSNPYATQTYWPDTPNQFSDREYITHTKDGTRSELGYKIWYFYWTAPSTDVGTITLSAAGMASNNNEDDTGDDVYTTSVQLSAGVTPGIKNTAQGQVQVYPNPFHAEFNIELPATMAAAKLHLIDLQGRVILEQEISGTRTIQAKVPKGLYFVRLTSGDHDVYTTRILKQ